MNGGRRGKGSGHMMVDGTRPRAPPLCTLPGPGLRRSGRGLGGDLQPSAGRRGTGPAAAGQDPPESLRVSDQKLGSCPRSRGAGGRGGDVAGAGSGRRVAACGPERGAASPRRDARPCHRSGAAPSKAARDWSRCAAAATGGVRAPSAGGEAGCGCGMTFSNSVIMAALTTPNSSSRAAATSCRLGGPGLSRFGLAAHPAAPPGLGLPLPEGLPMALVGRRVLLNQAAASQSGSLGRETDRGHRLPVDLLEDRPLSRRRLRPGADRLGDGDDGVRGQRDVSPLPGGRPSGRDQLAGLTPLRRARSAAAARAGSTSPPAERS